MTNLAEQRDVFGMPPAPTLPVVAVDRLPRGELGVPELDEDPYWRLVDCVPRRLPSRADAARVLHRPEGLVRLVRRT